MTPIERYQLLDDTNIIYLEKENLQHKIQSLHSKFSREAKRDMYTSYAINACAFAAFCVIFQGDIAEMEAFKKFSFCVGCVGLIGLFFRADHKTICIFTTPQNRSIQELQEKKATLSDPPKAIALIDNHRAQVPAGSSDMITLHHAVTGQLLERKKL